LPVTSASIQSRSIGNLTDDPELRFTANGAAVASFRLAVTPRIRQGDQ
jgi:single-stranded DNA-binding protein